MKNLPIVLVVEDDKAIVHLLSTILDANDYRVVQVSTGREALSTISSHCPDVVLLDLGLPDMDGVDIIKNGRLTIDYDKRRIYLDDQEVHLTQVEYKIVMLTMLHIGKVLTYDFIIRCVWGARPTVNNQILRVNMANIRRKLEANPADPQFIITETGVGYRMIDHAEENV